MASAVRRATGALTSPVDFTSQGYTPPLARRPRSIYEEAIELPRRAGQRVTAAQNLVCQQGVLNDPGRPDLAHWATTAPAATLTLLLLTQRCGR